MFGTGCVGYLLRRDGWPLHGFRNRLGIAVVVLVTFEERLDVLRRHQTNIVSKRGELAAYVVPARQYSKLLDSWPSAVHGWAALPIFCARAPIVEVTTFRGTVPAGRQIHARSLAACAARRPSCGLSVSRLPSLVKAAPERGSSGYIRCSETPSTPSAPSAACATTDSRCGSDTQRISIRGDREYHRCRFSGGTCARGHGRERQQWTGSASDLLQVGSNRSGWPKSPRGLAGRLRRVQTFLRTLGIEIVFGREGRLGTRTIRITAIGEDRSRNTVCTVCSVRGDGARVGTTAAAIGGESATTVSPRFGRPVPAIGLVLSQAADDAADGADANAAFQGGPTDSGSV